MRIPRKSKKQIIKVFGKGTYQAVLYGYLYIESYKNGSGCISKYTGKKMGKTTYLSGQYNPYINFKKIWART